MRKISFFILWPFCLLSMAVVLSGASKKQKEFVQFGSNRFVCTHEVTNEEYRTYLNFLSANHQTDLLKISWYDSTLWQKKFPGSSNDPMTQFYHSHPAYSHYPVVNISFEAMKGYCLWLTQELNAGRKEKVEVYLPSEFEWGIFSNPLPGHNLPWYGNFNYLPGNPEIHMANIKFKVAEESKANFDYIYDGCVYTCPSFHYPPNKLGLYHVIGNVAEVTSGGIVKGGSWDNELQDCTIEKSQEFQPPDPRVGFRIAYRELETSSARK